MFTTGRFIQIKYQNTNKKHTNRHRMGTFQFAIRDSLGNSCFDVDSPTPLGGKMVIQKGSRVPETLLDEGGFATNSWFPKQISGKQESFLPKQIIICPNFPWESFLESSNLKSPARKRKKDRSQPEPETRREFQQSQRWSLVLEGPTWVILRVTNNNRLMSVPIGSMGLIYLPTNTILYQKK